MTAFSFSRGMKYSDFSALSQFPPRGGAIGDENSNEHFWSVNVGGLRGLWQLARFVQGSLPHCRPSVLLVQEVSLRIGHEPSIEGFWDRMGYKTYFGLYGGYIVNGMRKGVISFVLSSVKSSMQLLLGQEFGALLGIEVEGNLVINSYAHPDYSGNCQQEQAALVEEMLVTLNWRNQVILGGDHNEEWSSSWISIVAAIRGLDVVHPDTDSTRWGGSRVIDYFLVDDSLDGRSWTHQAKINHHKIVVLAVKQKWQRQIGQRFGGYQNFRRPGWVSMEEWQSLVSEAVSVGIRSNWLEICYDMNHTEKWVHLGAGDASTEGGGTCPSDLCYPKPGCWGIFTQDSNLLSSQGMEQEMIDYGWEFFSRKLIWVLRLASYFALLAIPESYDNLQEIKKIEDLYNGSHRRGTNVLQTRRPPNAGSPCSIKVRKLRNRLGRALELRTHLQNGKNNQGTQQLFHKLFGKKVGVEKVAFEIDTLQQQLDLLERVEKYHNLANWRDRLQSQSGAKGAWLKPKNGKKNVSLKQGEFITQTKRDTAIGLRQAWLNMLEKVKWTEEEREQAILEMRAFYDQQLKDYDKEILRPKTKVFAEALKRVSGCPGLDGWSTDEVSVVVGNNYLCEAAWKEMQLWEDYGCTPSSIKDILLLFIPKGGKRFEEGYGESGDFRPLSIFSIFWRAWSSAWISEESFHQYVQYQLPIGLAASHKGGMGAEALAAVLAHQLDHMGYGCTLDFTSCFDTVDLGMIKDSLGASLPQGLRKWFQLLLGQWMGVRKWIGTNGYIHELPVRATTGIPQGDGASPIILAFVLWQGYWEVEIKMHSLGGSFFQGIYMDDRTILADRPDMVEEAIATWQAFADKRKLLENPKKAQKVSVVLPIPGFSDRMEVLGVMIGKASIFGIDEDAKQNSKLALSLGELGSFRKPNGKGWRISPFMRKEVTVMGGSLRLLLSGKRKSSSSPYRWPLADSIMGCHCSRRSCYWFTLTFRKGFW